MRKRKQGEYLTTLTRYYKEDPERTQEYIAVCCGTTKENICKAMKEAKAGTRREVQVYVDEKSDCISYAFTCGPVFGFKG